MAETSPIAQLAEKLSDELFRQFGWSKVKPINTNWACAVPETHSKRNTSNYTHPSDVVHYYEDPYSDRVVYVNTDLKSYAKDSITRIDLTAAIRSLQRAVDCAHISSDFQQRFISHQDRHINVVGLLFIYNHDGQWDSDFGELSRKVELEHLEQPKGREVFVFGPERISFLYNIATDIVKRRGLGLLPEAGECHFFYPDLVQAHRHDDRIRALSIEAMTAPWIIQQWETDGRQHSTVYCAGSDSVDDFVYLIDYLFKYQQVDRAHKIEVRAVENTLYGGSSFERAKHQYIIGLRAHERSAIEKRINQIGYHTVDTFVPNLSSYAIGFGAND